MFWTLAITPLDLWLLAGGFVLGVLPGLGLVVFLIIVRRPDGVWVVGRRVGKLGQLNACLEKQIQSRTAELRQGEERLALAFEAAEMGWWEWEVRTDQHRWSARFEELLGCAPGGTFPGGVEAFLERVHPDDRERMTATAHPEDRPAEIEYRVIWPDGTVRWLQSLARAYRDDTGAVVRLIGVDKDITERKRLETALRDSEARSRTILESIRDAFFALDPDWTFTYVNREAERVLLRRKEELLGRNIWAEFPEAVGSTFYDEYHHAVSGRVAASFEGYYPPLGKWFEVTAYPSETGLSVYFRDFSERRLAEAALRRSEGLHRTLVQFSREVVEILDREGNLLYVSANVAALGFDPEFWKTHRVNIFTYIPAEYQAKAHQLLTEVLGDSGTVGPLLMPLRRPGAQENLWFEVLLENRLDDPDIAGIVLRARDVTEQRAYQATIHHMAYHDPLTGLANRRLFLERLEAALAEGLPLAVGYLDLDRFKLVNDTLGHTAGDGLLQEVGRRLTQALRGSDTVARLGGDEFALLFPVLDRERAVEVAERILGVLDEPVVLEGQELRAGASLGLSLYPADGTEAEMLLGQADAALRRAKGAGRGGFALYQTEMGREASEQLRLESGLRRALARGELEVHYQPQVELASGKPQGFEALVRWRHPQEGLIPPARFIPVAEESGLIVPLGTWVLRAACRQAALWGARVAVNVSALQFTRTDFLDTVWQALEEAELPPQLLELEITESAVMSDPERAARQMRRLRAWGVRLSLDDFGTGYSSLSQLRLLPLDTLKLDRSFVRNLGEDPAAQAMVEAVARLAGGLGLELVVEGVETEAQRRSLLELGCRKAQGYLFSPPKPAAELEDWMVQPSRSRPRGA